jgi:predicted NACHT family NTPase
MSVPLLRCEGKASKASALDSKYIKERTQEIIYDEKTFNIAGPCHPNKHDMLRTIKRCKSLMQLIEQEQYFVIHAARQSGKTTLLLELARQLNEAGNYYALYRVYVIMGCLAFY